MVDIATLKSTTVTPSGSPLKLYFAEWNPWGGTATQLMEIDAGSEIASVGATIVGPVGPVADLAFSIVQRGTTGPAYATGRLRAGAPAAQPAMFSGAPSGAVAGGTATSLDVLPISGITGPTGPTIRIVVATAVPPGGGTGAGPTGPRGLIGLPGMTGATGPTGP